MRSADTQVRELGVGELQEALALSTAAGWNQQLDDWRMLRTLAAPAAFAAVIGERLVGTALAIDYGPVSWVAVMLGETAPPRKGGGTQVLASAVSAGPSKPAVRL